VLKVANVVGARPNFMKIAPIVRAMREDPFFRPSLVHTGQHYDEKMSDVFFDELGIPAPDVNLSVGSGSHGRQTGQVMVRFEEVVTADRPDLVIVVGDVNSTLAAALVAAKLHIPVAHVEAGLRSFDRTMPEEINRVLTDSISDFLFTTERSAEANLTAEGIDRPKVFFVGNVMIDALLANRRRAAASDITKRLELDGQRYGVLTLHRPSNVDAREPLTRIAAALERVGGRLPIVFPAHPRTVKNLEAFGLLDRLQAGGKVRVVEPLGYLDFLRLVDCSALVLTDSGGLQEETTVLGVPCITLRENTERPVTVEQGTNVLVGSDTDRIVAASESALQTPRRTARVPELWDGKAAGRILTTLRALLSG
jgi:UDP-N-acetylglucosamine 2-epimerase (non-hydrolysing)